MSQVLTTTAVAPLTELRNSCEAVSTFPSRSTSRRSQNLGAEVGIEREGERRLGERDEVLPVVGYESDVALSNGRIVIVIAALGGVNFLNSLSNGFLTVGLPSIAKDLGLSSDLLSW